MKKIIVTHYWLLLLALPLFSGGCIKAAGDMAPDTGTASLSGTTMALAAAAATPYRMLPKVIFNGGNEGGYHSFRIPSIIRAGNGMLIAFAEGRKNNNSDFGDIDLVCKRSSDNGETWGALQVVQGQGTDTWGNPTAVYDATTGRVWLFMSWNDGSFTSQAQMNYWGSRRVRITYSDNNGASWAAPADSTAALTPSTFKWDCVGPGIGIQTQSDHPGRLIIPALDRNIYSDDHGATWKYSRINWGGNESTIMEKMNNHEGGWLVRIDRPRQVLHDSAAYKRRSVGNIGGSWSWWAQLSALPNPGSGGCEGSLLRYNTDAPHRTLYMGPNSPDKRCDMSIWVSYNDGTTWPVRRSLFSYNTCDYGNITAGRGGYSSMAKTADYCVAALTEQKENLHSSASNQSIEFHKFNLAWILENNPE